MKSILLLLVFVASCLAQTPVPINKVFQGKVDMSQANGVLIPEALSDPTGLDCAPAKAVEQYQGKIFSCPSGTLKWTAASGTSSSGSNVALVSSDPPANQCVAASYPLTINTVNGHMFGCVGSVITQVNVGTQGPQGIQGVKGDKGDTGNAGTQGLTGSTGPQGPTGPVGSKGDTGNTGPAGPTGATGIQGATGLQGPAGSTGSQGPQGVKGDKGDAGNTGSQGPAGPAPTSAPNTVVAGPASGSSSGTAAPRSLVEGDIPSLHSAKIVDAEHLPLCGGLVNQIDNGNGTYTMNCVDPATLGSNSAQFTATLTSGNSYTYTYTHNLNTAVARVSCIDSTSKTAVLIPTSFPSNNTVTLTGASAETLTCVVGK